MKIKYIILFLLMFCTYLTAEAQNLRAEFTADTIQVEQNIRNMLERNYTTVGMIEASNQLEKEYDVLLNKYYKKLLDSVNDPEDKEVIRNAQRNWLKLRDSDIELIQVMKNKTYEEMGGGTVWNVISASARAYITKNRVIELFNYLNFSDIVG